MVFDREELLKKLTSEQKYKILPKVGQEFKLAVEGGDVFIFKVISYTVGQIRFSAELQRVITSEPVIIDKPDRINGILVH